MREPAIPFGTKFPPLEWFRRAMCEEVPLRTYFSSALSISLESEISAWGFKCLQNHMDERQRLGLWDFLVEQGFHIINLDRDPAALSLSGKIAGARETFNIREDDPDSNRKLQRLKPVSLDPEGVVNEARTAQFWADKWRERLNESGLPYIWVSYEEYTSDRAALLARLHRFLGVAPELPGHNAFLRVTSASVWSDITNAEEVFEALTKASIDTSVVGHP